MHVNHWTPSDFCRHVKDHRAKDCIKTVQWLFKFKTKAKISSEASIRKGCLSAMKVLQDDDNENKIQKSWSRVNYCNVMRHFLQLSSMAIIHSTTFRGMYSVVVSLFLIHVEVAGRFDGQLNFNDAVVYVSIVKSVKLLSSAESINTTSDMYKGGTSLL